LLGAAFRRAQTLVAVGVSVLGALVVAAPAAQATAAGCTWAPGGAAAQQCIYVSGDGTYVSYVMNQYYASPISGYAANVCNRRHRTKFVASTGATGYIENDPSSCILGSVAVTTGDYTRWDARRHLLAWSDVCAKSANSDTGGSWTPSACETIEP
jgi:hypothetical protein